MRLNKPSPRLAILRAQLVAKAADEAFARALYSYSAQNPRTLRALPPLADSLPLPPSYWDDLEHWLKTLAPAKPAAGDAYVSAKQHEPAADVWHSEPPSVAGVYLTKTDNNTKDFARPRWWDGSKWHMNSEWQNPTMDAVRSMAVRSELKFGKLQWLRLIEADKPAQQPEQTASTRHVVCIKSHICNVSGVSIRVGQINGSLRHHMQQPECWLPCDESGWVTHVPTADGECPVPQGLKCEVQFTDGVYSALNANSWDWSALGGSIQIMAWRPIAQS